jgi:hypothetical protein
MRRQRTWRVRRTGVAMAAGQQRWDRAYQLLLRWATTRPSAPAEPPALSILREVPHAYSDLQPCFDQSSGRSPDY